MQTLMLGLRVLHHVVLLGEVNPPATNTLVTVVKHGNVGSTRNVLNARFVACGPLPAWLRYDALSWHGENVKDDWQYFRATRDTAAYLAERLVAVGALNGRFGLTAAAGALDVELVGFRDIALGAGDIRGLAARSYAVELSDLPPELLYPDDLNDWGG